MSDKKDWLERAREERKELRGRLDRLENFIDLLNSGGLRIMDQPEQYALLIEQRAAMRIYLSALDNRIELGAVRERRRQQAERLR